MRRLKNSWLGVCLFAGVFCSMGRAGTILYSNFPIGADSSGGFPINGGDTESDAFTIAVSGVMTGVSFGVLENPGDPVSQVSWEIGTTAFGSDLGSGTASTTDVLVTSPDPFSSNLNIDEVSFAISPIAIGPGTYYLTLFNAADAGPAYWDQASPTGGITWNQEGAGSPTTDTAVESLQITGTPEPGTFGLIMVGLGALGLARRRLVLA